MNVSELTAVTRFHAYGTQISKMAYEPGTKKELNELCVII